MPALPDGGHLRDVARLVVDHAHYGSQMSEAIQNISRDYHDKMVAYIRAVSVDIISPVQVVLRA